ncbi:MAG: LysM peptidoglycan-binding domain-containing protein [Sporichthyaceae bacterium]
MTHPNPDRTTGKSASELWRGLGALAALLALLFGPPLALLAAVGNPVPDQTVVGGQFTDAAIVGLLAGIVWLAWAQLAVVVTVEAVAAVRGHGLPRVLPGCGFTQHFARRLVVTASLLLAGTGPLVAATASASPAVAATAAADCRTEPVAAPTPAADTPTRASERATISAAVDTALGSLPALAPAKADDEQLGPWYVVRPSKGHHYDSLWDIAERHLGDGLRWREIYDLNRHRPQADGQRLELARLIQPGWRLRMPADATGLPTEPATPKTKGEATPGVANVGPAKAEAAATVAQTGQTPAATTPPSVPQARRAPSGPTADPGGVAARKSSVPIGPAVTVPPPTLSAGPVLAADPATADAAAHDDDVVVSFGELTLGLGAVACAGLLAELARRRRRAQRFRRPGERLPRPSEPAAAAERQIRAANAELTVVDLRDALRLLAENCRAQRRSLPDVHAVILNATAATLHLGGSEDPVSPFVAGAENTWRLDSDLLADADRSDLAENGIDPFPALVSLGVTDDAVLLVNLEAAGTLTLAGSPTDTTPMLHALIAEFGTSLLSSTAHLVLTDCPPQLVEMLDHGRVTVLGGDQAEKWAHVRGRDVATILHVADASDLGHARVTDVADDVWAPAVLLIGASAGDAPSSGPGISIVRVAEKPGTGWALHRIEDGWVLNGSSYLRWGLVSPPPMSSMRSR